MVSVFKSVFKKYITAFMAIIIVSFTLLAIIMSSIITNYSIDVKRKFMESTARGVTQNLNDLMYMTGNDLDYILEKWPNIIEKSLVMYAEDTDSIIFIADSGGKVLITSNGGDTIKNIDPSIIKDVYMNKGDIYQNSDLKGALAQKHLNYIYPMVWEPVRPGNDYNATDTKGNIGAIFICSNHATSIVEQMTETILISLLWVFIVALIAIYLISEKITQPLKEMSRAAKAFAQGKFDVRVPVRGKDEIAELAVAFNNMAGSLAKFEDMRRTFLANISHDLRTPMTTIAGFIDGVIDGAIPPEKHSHYLGIVASEVRRLSRLVNSLLDISRMQAGERKFTKVSFDLCEMSRQILISCEKRIDEKKLEVEFNCDSDKMYAFADKDSIYQILYNLCDNAVKFSYPSGLLSININKKDKKLFVSIKNTGEGIEAEDLPFVFERFYKSDRSRGLDKTGVGLGLYIVKTIIDQHEEEIWVNSEKGNFCEFVFTLREGNASEAIRIKE